MFFKKQQERYAADYKSHLDPKYQVSASNNTNFKFKKMERHLSMCINIKKAFTIHSAC